MIKEKRPWGEFEVLAEGDNWKVKRLTINPGHRLSLQMHKHRSETWVITNGVGEVTASDETRIEEKGIGHVYYLPRQAKHRITNNGKIPLELIEVQRGEYFGEDDEERLEDDYGRK